MLVCAAHVCAALRMIVCQVLPGWFSAGLLLNTAFRLLVGPPRLVPSGMMLIVISPGFGQRLPVVE